MTRDRIMTGTAKVVGFGGKAPKEVSYFLVSYDDYTSNSGYE